MSLAGQTLGGPTPRTSLRPVGNDLSCEDMILREIAAQLNKLRLRMPRDHSGMTVLEPYLAWLPKS